MKKTFFLKLVQVTCVDIGGISYSYLIQYAFINTHNYLLNYVEYI